MAVYLPVRASVPPLPGVFQQCVARWTKRFAPCPMHAPAIPAHHEGNSFDLLFLVQAPISFLFCMQLVPSNRLSEEKAGHLYAVCLGFSRISTPVITTPLSAQGPAAVTQVTDMYCFRPSSLMPIRCIGSFTLAAPACPATGLCSFSRTAPFRRSARDRARS